MRQHAGLRGHLVAGDDGVEHLEQPHHVRDVVERRVDADDGIAAAIEQAVEHAGSDAREVVGRVVRLQPRRHTPSEADGIAEPGDDTGLACRQHEILRPHDLRDGCRHLWCDTRSHACQHVAVHVVGEEPLAEAADGQVGDRCERGRVVAVHDEARDLVGFVGNEGLLEERAERDVGQGHLRGGALDGGSGADTCQPVTRALGCGARQQCPQVVEHVTRAVDHVRVGRHCSTVLSGRQRSSRPCRGREGTRPVRRPS